MIFKDESIVYTDEEDSQATKMVMESFKTNPKALALFIQDCLKSKTERKKWQEYKTAISKLRVPNALGMLGGKVRKSRPAGFNQHMPIKSDFDRTSIMAMKVKGWDKMAPEAKYKVITKNTNDITVQAEYALAMIAEAMKLESSKEEPDLKGQNQTEDRTRCINPVCVTRSNCARKRGETCKRYCPGSITGKNPVHYDIEASTITPDEHLKVLGNV